MCSDGKDTDAHATIQKYDATHHGGADIQKSVHQIKEKHQVEVHHSEHKRPTRGDVQNSVCLFVSAKLKYDSHEFSHIKDLVSFREHAKGGAFEPWSHIKGLRNKVFWLNPEDHTTGGFYTFYSRHHLECYLKSDLFESMKKVPFMTDVEFEIHENLAGSELCADIGVWK